MRIHKAAHDNNKGEIVGLSQGFLHRNEEKL